MTFLHRLSFCKQIYIRSRRNLTNMYKGRQDAKVYTLQREEKKNDKSKMMIGIMTEVVNKYTCQSISNTHAILNILKFIRFVFKYASRNTVYCCNPSRTVGTTLYGCRFNVLMSFQRPHDVVLTLCVSWDVSRHIMYT